MPRLLALVLVVIAVAPGVGREPSRDSKAPSAPAAAGPRFALLVGVTRYQHHASIGLEGPANDVELMRKLLTEKFAFADDGIVTLSEAAGTQDPKLLPTRANIEREIKALAAKAAGTKGARVVVYLSGHGTRQPDLIRPDPKPDGRSQVFLPKDFTKWDNTTNRLENGIIDFELRDWLAAIRDQGALVWAVIDCCHSGTIARALFDQGVPRKVEENTEGLAIPRQAFVDAEKRGADEDAKRRAAGQPEIPVRSPIDGPKMVAIYACLPTETTFEDTLPYYPKDETVEQRKYGVLTWHLAEVLNDVTAPGGPDLTFAELVKRVQAKYRRLGIDHPTPLVEGADSRELVLWARPGAARRTPVLLNRAQNGALTVTAGRLNGLVENSVLAVYPPPGKGRTRTHPLGHVLVTRARPTESDVAVWDEAKAPDFQKRRFTAPAQRFEGGERCEVVMASYGDLKLRVAAAPAGDDGKPLDPASVRRVQEQLKGLGESGKQFVDVVGPPVAQWLVREAAKPAAGRELELFRREGMATGPLAVPGGADKLAARLTEIARAQMLIRLETGDAPPAEDKVKAGEAVAFDIELLRQVGGAGEFKPVSLASGAGPVLQVSDRVQLRFTNRGRIPVDVTVLQIDQNYDINQFFPRGGATVANRVALPDQIVGSDKGLYTSRQKVQQDGVTGLKDENGVQGGFHQFVVIGVKGEGEPVDFRDLASPTAGEKDIKRGLPGDARTVLRALQGQGDARAGFGRDVTEDFVVRVIRFEIEYRPPGGK